MAIKLTIGTAVYNVGEEFLRAHLDGIVKQLTDETELLVIDDCSTDNSGDICKEYAEKYSYVRYINMGKNSGLSCVRNRTVSEARGKWVFFADGDDLMSENFIKTALSFYEDDHDIIIIDRGIFTEGKPEEKPCTATKLTEVPEGSARELSLSCMCLKPVRFEDYCLTRGVFYHAAWGALYRRDFLLQNDLTFPAGQKKAQDSVFNTYAYFAAKKIAYLPYTMYYYRKNMLGITKRYNPDYIEIIRSLMKHHYDSMAKLYPGETEVETLYKRRRVITLLLDSMRLDFFHKDNPKPREVRKKEFIDFVSSEPFKSAIEEYDMNDYDWWEWPVLVSYAKKKQFSKIEFAFKHPALFKIYGGIPKRIKKALRKKK